MDKPKGKPGNNSKRDVIDIDENTIALGSPWKVINQMWFKTMRQMVNVFRWHLLFKQFGILFDVGASKEGCLSKQTHVRLQKFFG